MGIKTKKIANLICNLPSLLTQGNLVRIVKHIKLFGLTATYKEAGIKLSSDETNLFNGAINTIPVTNHIKAMGKEAVPNEDATISVVIPVKNAGDGFRHLLSLIKNQKGFKDLEIIIVDSGSTDRSLDMAAEFGARIVQILPEEFSHSYARNVGAELAIGDYLLFTVQDALPPSHLWLHHLFSVIKDNGVVAVSCTEFPKEDADLFYRAITWDFYKYLEVDQQDRIMSKPENENYVTLRKNAQLSNIACLISRDVFMKYRFRRNYAEDLDLGIRLIRDGYKLAFLSSTRIIHSHNRPAYYYLKRGYVDSLSVFQILPDYPVPVVDLDKVLTEMIFIYDFVDSIVTKELRPVAFPSTIADLTTILARAFRTAVKSPHTRIRDIGSNGYIDNKFRYFMEHVYTRYDVNYENNPPHDGVLLDAMNNLTMIICRYMDHKYELIDDTLLEELRACLYKACAFTCGTQLACCFLRGCDRTKERMREINNELTKEI